MDSFSPSAVECSQHCGDSLLDFFSSRRKLETDLFELLWMSRAFSSRILTLKNKRTAKK